jgi:DnaD/phage-associated family protein
MAYRLIYTSFWSDPKVMEEMTPEDKLFYSYILTNPSTTNCGIYMITKKQMAFEIGYSIEAVNSLMDRFEKHHKLIIYNKETRELAIKNWGKHNLSRGGKPVIDCLTSELSKVKDKTLIKYICQNIKSGVISDLYKSFYDTTTSGEPQGDNTDTNTERDTYANTSNNTDTERDTNTKTNNTTSTEKDTNSNSHINSEITLSENKKESTHENKESYVKDSLQGSQELSGEDPNNLSVSLLQEYEKLTGHIGELNLGAVKIAIIQHGYCNVKKAMNKAVEKDKYSMSYINGILKIWAKEGYPEEVNSNGIRSSCKNTGIDTNKFGGFKAKEPRGLTEEERRSLELEEELL